MVILHSLFFKDGHRLQQFYWQQVIAYRLTNNLREVLKNYRRQRFLPNFRCTNQKFVLILYNLNRAI